MQELGIWIPGLCDEWNTASLVPFVLLALHGNARTPGASRDAVHAVKSALVRKTIKNPGLTPGACN